jgi:hypothetical protein
MDVLDAEDVVGDVLQRPLVVAALHGPGEGDLARLDGDLHVARVDAAAGDPLADVVADPLVGAVVALRPEGPTAREGV